MPTITELSRQHAQEAVEVLAHAFQNDPIVHYFLKGGGEEFQRHIRSFFNFSCEVRFDLEWSLFGCYEGARLMGVAGVTEPVDKPWPESLSHTYNNLKSEMGVDAVERLEKYAALSDAHRPTQPNYMVGVIGVHPDGQGKGYGRRLLDTVQELSESHPTSTGVALDTETPLNVQIYQRCGYQLLEELPLDAVKIYTMFRPNRPV